jgi:DNA-binding transcriptional LysR family regulator
MDAIIGEAQPNLEEIGAFLAIVSSGSFSRAAQVLAAPTSTVSRRVSRLETKLGVRLIQRTTRRLNLTDVGRAYSERVSNAVEAMAAAAQAVRHTRAEPRGHVRLTAPPDVWPLLAPVLCQFALSYPEVTVELELTGRIVDLVAEGFDLAMRASARLTDSSLIARRIGESYLALFASPEYLRGRGAPRRIEDLSRHRCILFRARGGHARWKLVGPRGTRQVAVSGPISGSDFGFVKTLAIEGAGIALMPVSHGAPELPEGRLVQILPQYRGGVGGVYVVYPSARLLSAKVRVLRDFIVERLSIHFE